MLFEDFYLHTFLPGDSFFQTVLMNTVFSEIIVNDDKRAVSVSGRNSGEQIEDLKNNNQLFIRKLDPEEDEEILKYIDESYNSALPEISDVERELKINRHQEN